MSQGPGTSLYHLFTIGIKWHFNCVWSCDVSLIYLEPGYFFHLDSWVLNLASCSVTLLTLMLCVCVCLYLLHSPLVKSSGTFYSRRGQCSDPRGEQRQCRVNRDVPPQLHNLTDLMKLFVMGFSPFSSSPVISGHACSLQRGWGQLIGTPFSHCLLASEQMIIKAVCYNTRSIICKEHSQS